jgi:hypothetical protein
MARNMFVLKRLSEYSCATSRDVESLVLTTGNEPVFLRVPK